MKARRALFVQYTNPAGYPPLVHAIDLLAARGWKVRVLGALPEGTRSLELSPQHGVDVRCAGVPTRGLLRRLDYVRFVAVAVAQLRRWRPDVVYASDALAAPVGLAAAALGVPVVYHEHDAPASPAPTRAIAWVLAARARLLRRAPLCVVPGEGRREILRAAGRPVGQETLVAWNTPTRAEVIVSSNEPPPPLRLHYHGTISPSLLPLHALDAVAQLGGAATLTAVGYETVGTRGHRQALAERARALGIEGSVELAGPLSRGRLLERARAAHVGLALVSRRGSNPNLDTLVGPSNKPFDYLASGLAVVVPDGPAWRETFVDNGLGRACDPDDPASIAAALRWFMEHPSERLEMARRGQKLVARDWCYERQFAPILDRLEQLVGRARG